MHMKGRILDIVLVASWVVSFFVVAMVRPGVVNFVIAWGGALTLGWYNAAVRHTMKDYALRAPWRRAATVA
jgi:arginine exporter protein ArgO